MQNLDSMRVSVRLSTTFFKPHSRRLLHCPGPQIVRYRIISERM
jgi:hypothetical protein